MRHKTFSILLLSILIITNQSHAEETPLPKIPTKEAASIFKAAGFKKTSAGWEANCDTGHITIYQDLNKDGLKDAVIRDYSTMCYGNTGHGYRLMAQKKNGYWKEIFSNSGMPAFLKTKGKDGWPDIENRGTGFCFAIYRWNGQEYDIHRYEYKGKSCSIL